MAKNKKVDLKKLLGSKFDDAFAKTLSKSNMSTYMSELAETVKLRTRLGGLAEKDQSSKTKAKPLKPSTVKYRQYLKKKGELSGLTVPKKSNLTMTGQMLDALTGKGLRVAIGIISVKSSKRKDRNIKNSDVAKYVTEQGRPFLNLTSKEVKELAQNIKRDLVKLLRKK